MKLLKELVVSTVKLLFFWVLLFDIERIVFSIHNFDKFKNTPFTVWLEAFIYSFRLDLATAGLLSLLPFIVLIIFYFRPVKWSKMLFYGILFVEFLIIAAIHAGEVNAYPEWNHKLTSRVFIHLLNPDEVVRTADYKMTIGYFFYLAVELFLSYKLMKWLFRLNVQTGDLPAVLPRIGILFGSFIVIAPLLFLAGRGGLQPIPINIDSAYYAKQYAANDLSVNSTYFFVKNYIQFARSESGALFPKIPEEQAKKYLSDFYNYPEEHTNLILKDKHPNIVFIIMESWTANAIGSITGEKGATPNFDKLAGEGLLFTNIYATGGTSEIGNTCIFSGYPALPEVSISMEPDKNRKLPSLNQDLKKWGYSSHYLFSGDLKYGNIGGYFIDHGFDEVQDEKDFPKGLPRGKLNYYDEDLYKILLKKMDETKGPFMHCAFTGSTHSPYDYPDRGTPKWDGSEKDFMSSVYYADKCLGDFLKACKKHKWYKNTLFILVADHGHASPAEQDPNLGSYFHIPVLMLGEPLKEAYRGQRIDKVGSQADIVRTLLYQMHGDHKRYVWSKDLLNPAAPQFALHTINRGYGWMTDKGHFSYNMDGKNYPENSFDPITLQKEKNRCHSYMSLIYDEYKAL